ncbi:hypothetical protein, partial [uncultured Hymenobacter sp.]|uniref:hypothetical protein n=1 Tax=uncultured Hymenobacter sp. TaxID=170016 RepID=UPI0035CB4876
STYRRTNSKRSTFFRTRHGLVKSQKRREELHEWQHLSHRKSSFQKIAQLHFLEVEDSREFFERVRHQWQLKLGANNAPGYYATFIDYFNIDNYIFTQISPTQQRAVYREQLEQQVESEASRTNSRIDGILSSAITKRKVIDNASDGALSEQELNQLWEEVKFLENVREAVLARASSFSNPHAVAAATATIFLLRGQQWLAQYPERQAWAALVLLSGTQELWKQRNEETELRGVGGLHPSDFIAEGLPVLWVEDNESKEVRQAVGRLMLTASVEGLRRFIKQAADHRSYIGLDYYRAAHLRMLRAWQWYQRAYPNGKMTYQLTPKLVARITNALDLQRDGWLTAFVERQLDSTLPRLNTLTKSSGRRRRKQVWESPVYGRELKPHPFQEDLMAAAYAGLPTPVKEPTWLSFWLQTLTDMLARLQPELGEKRIKLDGFPREFDSWFFSQVVIWLPQLPPKEARRFWEPILALGLWAYEWIKKFLFEWTRQAFMLPSNASLQQVWREMIDYALLNPSWTLVDRTLSNAKGEQWRSLLALDFPNYWYSEHQGLAESLRPRWATWARTNIGNPQNARAMATFLAKPAAGGMILEGLQWLAHPITCSQPELSYWDKILEPIADLLTHVWHSQAIHLRQDITAFESFKKLLNVLVARRHALGLQLNQLVGQS